MGQSLSPSQTLRNGENAGGFKNNRKVQTHRKEISRRGAANAPPHARKPGKRLEENNGKWWPIMDQTERKYMMRCPDLGLHDWNLVEGHNNVFAALKTKLARIDTDLKNPVSIGNKTVTFEVRYPDSNHIMRYECTGYFVSYYNCRRLT